MKIVLFNNKHRLDLDAEIRYFDRKSLQDVSSAVDVIKAFNPDLIIEEEKNDGVSLFTPIYDKLPGIPKAWWCIDAHCNLINHVVYAKQFDYIFCAQSWFVPIIQKEVLNKVFYLPLCHTQTLTEYEEMLRTQVKKDVELSFIGNIRTIHVDRMKHVAYLMKKYGEKFVARQSDYQTMLNWLRRSKVTFNCSLNNDLNFRVFEAIACGAVLLTDDVTDLDSIYGLRDRVVAYDKLLPDWQTTDVPYRDGEAFIKHKHTLTHRMSQLLTMVQTGEQYEY